MNLEKQIETQLEEHIQQIEISNEDAQKVVDRANALKRLFNNNDFITIISNGYLKDYAVAQVLRKGRVGISPQQVVEVQAEIDSIGFFNSWLSSVLAAGRQMENTIKANDEELEEIRYEQEHQEDAS